MNIIRLAMRYAFGARLQGSGGIVGLLSVVGLAIGSALLIAVLSVMNGFDRDLREKILAMVPHIRILPAADFERLDLDLTTLGSIEGVQSATPYREMAGLIRFRGQVRPVLVWAIAPALEAQGGALGRHLGPELVDGLAAGSGVYLGARLAERIGAENDALISLVGVQEERSNLAGFPVRGTFTTHTEMDHRLVLISIQTLESAGLASFTTAGISVHTPHLFEVHAFAHDLLRQLPPGYRAVTWASSHGNLYEAIQMSRHLVGMIVFLLLAIAAFNVVGSLMITSADRQSDIAVLKTLGASRRQLLGIFTLQGFMIGCFGAISGLVLGLGLAYSLPGMLVALENLFQVQFLQSNVYPLDYLPVEINLWQAVGVSLVAVALSTMGSVYPALRVLDIHPAHTLRYE